nr:3-oxoacyl-[acyl-carrier-protein] reductase fabg [Quercus suber]
MDVPGFALITGAASGIGRACARGFLNEGSAGIALFDINLEDLEKVKAELEKSQPAISGNKRDSCHAPCRIEIFQVNVANEEQVQDAVNKAHESFGRLDYVVNAAGIAMKHVGGVAFAETSDWSRILNVNLDGTFFVLRATAKIMLEQEPIHSSIDGRPLQRGSIVNFSSIQGVVGITLSAAYTTSKHAIIGLTRSASEDYSKDGLRINAICPGYTETPLTTRNPDVLKAMQERIGTAVPMQRMGQPSEIADGVLYLAGGRSSFVTGSALMVQPECGIIAKSRAIGKARRSYRIALYRNRECKVKQDCVSLCCAESSSSYKLHRRSQSDSFCQVFTVACGGFVKSGSLDHRFWPLTKAACPSANKSVVHSCDRDAAI